MALRLFTVFAGVVAFGQNLVETFDDDDASLPNHVENQVYGSHSRDGSTDIGWGFTSGQNSSRSWHLPSKHASTGFYGAALTIAVRKASAQEPECIDAALSVHQNGIIIASLRIYSENFDDVESRCLVRQPPSIHVSGSRRDAGGVYTFIPDGTPRRFAFLGRLPVHAGQQAPGTGNAVPQQYELVAYPEIQSFATASMGMPTSPGGDLTLHLYGHATGLSVAVDDVTLTVAPAVEQLQLHPIFVLDKLQFAEKQREQQEHLSLMSTRSILFMLATLSGFVLLLSFCVAEARGACTSATGWVHMGIVLLKEGPAGVRAARARAYLQPLRQFIEQQQALGAVDHAMESLLLGDRDAVGQAGLAAAGKAGGNHAAGVPAGAGAGAGGRTLDPEKALKWLPDTGFQGYVQNIIVKIEGDVRSTTASGDAAALMRSLESHYTALLLGARQLAAATYRWLGAPQDNDAIHALRVFVYGRPQDVRKQLLHPSVVASQVSLIRQQLAGQLAAACLAQELIDMMAPAIEEQLRLVEKECNDDYTAALAVLQRTIRSEGQPAAHAAADAKDGEEEREEDEDEDEDEEASGAQGLHAARLLAGVKGDDLWQRVQSVSIAKDVVKRTGDALNAPGTGLLAAAKEMVLLISKVGKDLRRDMQEGSLPDFVRVQDHSARKDEMLTTRVLAVRTRLYNALTALKGHMEDLNGKTVAAFAVEDDQQQGPAQEVDAVGLDQTVCQSVSRSIVQCSVLYKELCAADKSIEDAVKLLVQFILSHAHSAHCLLYDVLPGNAPSPRARPGSSLGRDCSVGGAGAMSDGKAGSSGGHTPGTPLPGTTTHAALLWDRYLPEYAFNERPMHLTEKHLQHLLHPAYESEAMGFVTRDQLYAKGTELAVEAVGHKFDQLVPQIAAALNTSSNSLVQTLQRLGTKLVAASDRRTQAELAKLKTLRHASAVNFASLMQDRAQIQEEAVRTQLDKQAGTMLAMSACVILVFVVLVAFPHVSSLMSDFQAERGCGKVMLGALGWKVGIAGVTLLGGPWAAAAGVTSTVWRYGYNAAWTPFSATGPALRTVAGAMLGAQGLTVTSAMASVLSPALPMQSGLVAEMGPIAAWYAGTCTSRFSLGLIVTYSPLLVLLLFFKFGPQWGLAVTVALFAVFTQQIQGMSTLLWELSRMAGLGLLALTAFNGLIWMAMRVYVGCGSRGGNGTSQEDLVRLYEECQPLLQGAEAQQAGPGRAVPQVGHAQAGPAEAVGPQEHRQAVARKRMNLLMAPPLLGGPLTAIWTVLAVTAALMYTLWSPALADQLLSSGLAFHPAVVQALQCSGGALVSSYGGLGLRCLEPQAEPQGWVSWAMSGFGL